MVFLTGYLQRDLEVTLLRTTSKYMFILNVITSGFEILATLGDIYSMFCDYNAQRALVEKPLLFKHVFRSSTD